MDEVGIRELRQNLSAVLRRVERGESLVVTDRNRPVAQLGPVPSHLRGLSRLVREGRAVAPQRERLDFAPVPIRSTLPQPATRALEAVRGERH